MRRTEGWRKAAPWARGVGLAGLSLALLLASRGAGQPASERSTPALTGAAAVGDLAKVRRLLESGADVNARDAQGRTALLRAARGGHMEVVQALIDARADLDAADGNGLSALIAAARRNDLAMARALIAGGATLDLPHRGFGAALDVADREGHKELAALLRSHGARGSGASIGSRVCVTPWKGQGYCGTVTAVERGQWTLRVTSVVGCERGCGPDACSMERMVGGRRAASVQVGDEMRVEGACLTRIGLTPEEK